MELAFANTETGVKFFQKLVFPSLGTARPLDQRVIEFAVPFVRVRKASIPSRSSTNSVRFRRCGTTT